MKTPQKVLRFEMRACSCGMIPEDHFHMDAHSVIPWSEMTRAVEQYKAISISGEPIRAPEPDLDS